MDDPDGLLAAYDEQLRTDAEAMPHLVEAALARYQDDPAIMQVEWKTRGHDHAPGLHRSLLDHGFVAEEPESIMIGEARRLAVDVPLPDSVKLRQVRADSDVRAMCATSAQVFGDSVDEGTAMADALLRRLSLDDGMELWVAEADGEVVSSGRLEPVPGTDFAGIWGAPRSRGGVVAGSTEV